MAVLEIVICLDILQIYRLSPFVQSMATSGTWLVKTTIADTHLSLLLASSTPPTHVSGSPTYSLGNTTGNVTKYFPSMNKYIIITYQIIVDE